MQHGSGTKGFPSVSSKLWSAWEWEWANIRRSENGLPLETDAPSVVLTLNLCSWALSETGCIRSVGCYQSGYLVRASAGL